MAEDLAYENNKNMIMVLKSQITKVFLATLAKVPFGLSRTLAQFFLLLVWYGHGRLRNVTEVNLAICFPQLSEKDRCCLAKESILETIRTGLDMPRMWFCPKTFTPDNQPTITGKEFLLDALSCGKGVVVILPHLGHWEFFAMTLGQNFPCTVMYNPVNNIVAGDLEDLVKNARMRTGMTMVPADKKGVKEVLKALRRGELALIAPDQIPKDKKSMAFAGFFSGSAPTMTLIPNILQKTGARAVIGFAKRLCCGRYELVFKPADGNLYSEDLQLALSAMNNTVETIIAEAPAQYLWSYKRFRLDKNGRTDIYKKCL